VHVVSTEIGRLALASLSRLLFLVVLPPFGDYPAGYDDDGGGDQRALGTRRTDDGDDDQRAPSVQKGGLELEEGFPANRARAVFHKCAITTVRRARSFFPLFLLCPGNKSFPPAAGPASIAR